MSAAPQRDGGAADTTVSRIGPDARDATQRLAWLLELEAGARAAETLETLRFHAVNETRTLLEYRQAAWVDTGVRGRPRVAALSSQAVVERNAPLVRWLERCIAGVVRTAPLDEPRQVDANEQREHAADGADEFAPRFALLVPIRCPGSAVEGLLWLARETPWTASEELVATRLAETHAHAARALRAAPARARRAPWRRALGGLALVGALASLALPVRLSTVAPVEVVPIDPWVVTAPLDAAIEEVLVEPNSFVAADTPVLRFDDTRLRNQLRLAERSLEVATAEFRQGRQGAFRDARAKAGLAALEARVALATAERDFALEQLDRTRVHAGRDGIVLMPDPRSLVGRPVTTGQQIMQVADPAQLELRIDLPVEDAIVSAAGAEVRAFLDVAPTEAVAAHLTHSSYHAEALPSGVLAYRLRASLGADAEALRPGLRGTAKVYGEEVPLGFFLFRRPFAFARQLFGW